MDGVKAGGPRGRMDRQTLGWRGPKLFQESTEHPSLFIRLFVQQTLARHLGCAFQYSCNRYLLITYYVSHSFIQYSCIRSLLCAKPSLGAACPLGAHSPTGEEDTHHGARGGSAEVYSEGEVHEGRQGAFTEHTQSGEGHSVPSVGEVPKAKGTARPGPEPGRRERRPV